MSEEILIKHCSPTLAGIKTANLINLEFESMRELSFKIREFNMRFSKKGVRAICLKYVDKHALIYIFRPTRLASDLTSVDARRVLVSCGYAETCYCDSNSEIQEKKFMQLCIKNLLKKMAKEKEFPHEIGLFLGYPPSDVSCFIEEKCKGCKVACKFSGAWKVYTDEENALKTFSMYEKCKNIYYSQWKKGKPIERLIVGV